MITPERTPGISFPGDRLSTFLDLSIAELAPLYVYRVENDAEDLVSGCISRHNVQRLMHASFRKTLTDDCRLPQYDVASPGELADELRTERWRLLCRSLRDYAHLPPHLQVIVVRLLLGLGFHRFLRDLVPPPSPDAIASDEDAANRALVCAHASASLAVDSGSELDPREYELLVDRAPDGSLAKLWASVNLVVDAGKEKRRLDLTEHWCNEVHRALTAWSPLSQFDQALVSSRVHRATAFLPFLQGNRKETNTEMDLAEDHARRAVEVAATPKEQLLARENLMTALESRGKEALAFGDLELCERRTREMLELDRLDAKNFLELGDILARRKKLEEALDAYRWAGRLGPPATATAWYMAGQCLEALGRRAEAADCYLQTLACDPLGISAAERLSEVAAALGWAVLAEWSRRQVEQLLR
jgi:tetratricopeptide (TPR) repeat protein